ncbi:ABC-F type ribosomal protection protein [Gracilibacillus salitolerans]|uniref:ABC-F type ribosomal protection protein n=1 Tax=Gracilibacillus salitolerans TaxID=2663022 RepID=A0A5Q2TFJ9_9BACI|nr:ABC-F type ribosomal protection protein [Gracilibacillus salitolerans]QGH32987.1 ABC-F type ribosomal protection protein [Gracilibacillus salitolerans]
MLLQASDLTISVEAKTLLEIDLLEIYEGERIGLVGKNGTGKTTLLHTLAGKLLPEKGNVKHYGTVHLLPQLKAPDGHKSGGEITQDYIQKAFSNQSSILLADEPTTHLDTNHIDWVENTLKHWQGAYVVVSHDRAFLDATCNRIWEIDQGKLHEYKGNYQQYKKQKEQEARQYQQEYENYQTKKQQLERALTLKSEKAERATKKPKKTSASEAKITGAKPYFAKKQKKLQQTAKSIETRLEKLEKVEKPFEESPIKMDLPNQEKLTGKVLIRVENLDGNIGDQHLWNKANFLIKGGDKLAIIGANGSGKTTLIRKLIKEEKGGHLSTACKIAYFKQDLSILDPKLSILENVQEGSIHNETLIRTVLARLHFYRDQVHKKIGVLSGGERVKVTLAKLFLSNNNTLVLDEPTNFLDLEAMEALEKLLMEYEGTVIFVSHDRRFVEKIATKIISIEEQHINYFEGSYQQFKNREQTSVKDDREEKLLILETKITDVLSRLSIAPSEELEKEFQQLLKEKQQLSKSTDH